jgi:hypothetical protein
MLIVVMSVTLGLPPCGIAADRPAAVAKPRMVTISDSVVHDVSLTDRGLLRGAVVDQTGQHVANVMLNVRQGERIVARVQVGTSGQFAISDLRPGVYELTTAQGGSIYRVWAAGTGPPVAKEFVMVPNGQHVVRGQLGSTRRALILGGVIITSGVIGGVIGYNVRDFDPAS